MKRQNRVSRGHLRVGIAAAALATVLAGTVAAPNGEAQTYRTLYSFTGGGDGSYPRSDLVMDAAGNLYGTTSEGGASGQGTVFKLDTSGQETVLHSFTGSPDGAEPSSGLVRDAAGNLYGTTSYGGSSGNGTVFKVDASGNETVLHSFTGGSDGRLPYAAPVMDAAGNLYGTTYFGGAGNLGTVYKVDTSGVETVIHSLTNADGAHPFAGVILDAAGNLYGVATDRGAHNNGTVFTVDTSGQAAVLHSFNSSDGSDPVGSLMMDATGNLYGTTYFGGASNQGTVFKLDTSGNHTVLYSFTGGSDGLDPYARLIMDAAGNLYGTTSRGGSAYQGAIFELDASGNMTVLHTFTGGSDGLDCLAALLRDAAGTLYGVTALGGDADVGTVFKLSPPVTFDSLSGLVRQFVTQPLVMKVLLAEVSTAQAMGERGEIRAMDWTLRAFIYQVSLLSGRSLTAEQAAILTEQATALIQ